MYTFQYLSHHCVYDLDSYFPEGLSHHHHSRSAVEANSNSPFHFHGTSMSLIFPQLCARFHEKMNATAFQTLRAGLLRYSLSLVSL
jgi:hypothetical protein